MPHKAARLTLHNKRKDNSLIFPLPKGFVDDHGALEGTGGIHVAVDVRRGGDVASSQPLLDQFHLHALRDKERCAGTQGAVPCVM